jgi:hypothetical protein
VKARIRKLAIAKGKTEDEAETIVEAFSGHSMRARYATTAGAHDKPEYRIQQRMRHKARTRQRTTSAPASSGRNQASRGSGSEDQE